MRIGVLSLQGDYEAHARMLERLAAEHTFVRAAGELSQVDGLIIPGGESTTILKFLEEGDFLNQLRRLPADGKPIFGTCAGAILLAREVTNPPQASLGLMDITVERNGYGRQLDSAVRLGHASLSPDPVEMVFIRAPRIRDMASQVEVLAEYEGEPVCVRQELCLAATFHPELSGDPCFHQYFLAMVHSAKNEGAVQQV
jgi:5'-phosphate synthase pdxT subunit